MAVVHRDVCQLYQSVVDSLPMDSLARRARECIRRGVPPPPRRWPNPTLRPLTLFRFWCPPWTSQLSRRASRCGALATLGHFFWAPVLWSLFGLSCCVDVLVFSFLQATKRTGRHSFISQFLFLFGWLFVKTNGGFHVFLWFFLNFFVLFSIFFRHGKKRWFLIFIDCIWLEWICCENVRIKKYDTVFFLMCNSCGVYLTLLQMFTDPHLT